MTGSSILNIKSTMGRRQSRELFSQDEEDDKAISRLFPDMSDSYVELIATEMEKRIRQSFYMLNRKDKFSLNFFHMAFIDGDESYFERFNNSLMFAKRQRVEYLMKKVKLHNSVGANSNKKMQKQSYYLSRKLERVTLITYLKDDDSKPLQKVFSSSAASKKTKQWSMYDRRWKKLFGIA
ncbi:hypothetical protein L1987_59294 [Smallanthus sonchifolius]|uniref:Uncharacterized protein n=1 Tax=Smallanthus sonchifolius TaxID=185202 RepID=A0ACB9D5A4_9ASTR|nr:hypothetical protein L1987_59294 [Smallanthus sonchifolius]